jgi:hypothetical protein
VSHRYALLVGLVVILPGCSNHRPTVSNSVATPQVSATSTPSAAPTSAPLRLGEPISAGTIALVALADVAAHPASFRGKTIATTGTVTAVCQEMGCWMEIRDDRGQAHIRMHGHSFFVPKTASGHHARVQATVVDTKSATECEDEARADAGAALTKVELDATGVELD